jgi:hypothetical protein
MFQLFWAPFDMEGNRIKVSRKEYTVAEQIVDRLGEGEIPRHLRELKRLGTSLDEETEKFSRMNLERKLETARLYLNESLTLFIRESLKIVWYEHTTDPNYNDPIEGCLVRRMLDLGRFQGFESSLESLERILDLH